MTTPNGGQSTMTAVFRAVADFSNFSRNLAAAQSQVQSFGRNTSRAMSQVSPAGLQSTSRAVDDLSKQTERNQRITESWATRAVFGYGKFRYAVRDAALSTEQTGGKFSEFASRVAEFAAGQFAFTSFERGMHSVKAFVEESVQGAADVQKMNIVLDSLAHSAGTTTEATDAQVKSMEDLGFSTGGAQHALARMFQAQIDVSQATKLAKIAQDASTISGYNQNDALQRIILSVQTGSTRMLRYMGITVDSTAAMHEFARAHHTSANNLSELERQQAITNAVVAAGVKIQGTYAAASTTTAGKLSMIPIALEHIKESVGAALLPTVDRSVTFMLAKVTQLQHALEDPNSGISGALHTVANTVAAVGSGVGGVVRTLMNTVAAFWPIVRAFGQAFATTFGAEMLTALKAGVTAFHALGDALQFVGDLLNNRVIGFLLTAAGATAGVMIATTKLVAVYRWFAGLKIWGELVAGLKILGAETEKRIGSAKMQENAEKRLNAMKAMASKTTLDLAAVEAERSGQVPEHIAANAALADSYQGLAAAATEATLAQSGGGGRGAAAAAPDLERAAAMAYMNPAAVPLSAAAQASKDARYAELERTSASVAFADPSATPKVGMLSRVGSKVSEMSATAWESSRIAGPIAKAGTAAGSALSKAGGVFTKGLGVISEALPYVAVAAGAAAGALWLFKKANESAARAAFNASDAASKLATSLGKQEGPLKLLPDEHVLTADQGPATVGDAQPADTTNYEKVARDNKDLIRQLRKAPDDRQQTMLQEVAFQRVQHGASPQEALEDVKKLAKAAGNIEIKFSQDSFSTFKAHTDNLRKQVGGIADEIQQHGHLTTFSVANFHTDDPRVHELQNVAHGSADLFKAGSPTDALHEMAIAQDELTKKRQAGVITEGEYQKASEVLNRSFEKNIKVSGLSLDKTHNLNDMLKQISSQASSASQGTKDYAAALEVALKNGTPLEDAIKQVNDKMVENARSAAEVRLGSKAAADAWTAMGKAAQFSEGAVKALDDAMNIDFGKALEQSVQSLGFTLQDAFTLVDQSALTSAAAQADAYNQGLSKQADAQKKALSDQADRQKKAIQDRIDAEKRAQDEIANVAKRNADAAVGQIAFTGDYTGAAKAAEAADAAAAKAKKASDSLDESAKKQVDAVDAQVTASADAVDKGVKRAQRSWEDYAKTGTINLGNFATELERQNKIQTDWGKNLDLINTRYGPDVAQALQAMGRDGISAVNSLANASGPAAERVVRDIKSIPRAGEVSFAEFAANLTQQATDLMAWEGGLVKLAEGGFVDLANQFAMLGPDKAGKALKQLLKEPADQFQKDATRMNDAAKKTTDAVGDLGGKSANFALQAVAAWNSFVSSGSTNMDDFYKAVADKTGQTVDEVKAQLTRLNTEIPGLLPKNLAIKVGTTFDPTGLDTGVHVVENKYGVVVTGDLRSHPMAEGGILDGMSGLGGRERHEAQIAAGGDYRVWAEPETGGEAYIPLTPSKRQRSEGILAQVASHFGMYLEKYAAGGVSPTAPGNHVVLPVLSAWLDTPKGGAAGSAASGGKAPAAPTDVHGNVLLGKNMAADAGWTGSEWDNLYALWNQESGWRSNAGSPSHAYGIPQADPGSKMAAFGRDWLTNAATQIAWGINYIQGRYSTPSGAQAHKRATDSRLGSHAQYAQPGGWYADGGVNRGSSMRVWAEPETGGEAYIPLGNSKRGNSVRVLRDVAKRFGYKVANYAAGGMVTGSGTTANFSPFDPSSFVQSQAQASQLSQYNAYMLKHPDSTRSQDTFAPQIDISAFQKSLDTSLQDEKQWAADVATVTARAGSDVSSSLAAMGLAGKDIVHEFATASDADLAKLTQTMKDLADATKPVLSTFSATFGASLQQAQDFQKNLLTLASRGQGDLASELAGMGAEQGGALAAQAAADPTQAAAIQKQVKAANDLAGQNLDTAIKVLNDLSTHKHWGVRQVAEDLKIDPQAVIDAAKPILAQIKALPAINGAEFVRDYNASLKGVPFAQGGFWENHEAQIANRARTWAEPETGGEAYIPLGHAKRGRSVSIWKEVGKRLGVSLRDHPDLLHTLRDRRHRRRTPEFYDPITPSEAILPYAGFGQIRRFADGGILDRLVDALVSHDGTRDRLEAFVQRWRDRRHPKEAPEFYDPITPSEAVLPYEGFGQIHRFARGGENHVAQIANRMRLWAEPETGGEAYIPLGHAKRGRSVEIWKEVGKRLGVQLSEHPDLVRQLRSRRQQRHHAEFFDPITPSEAILPFAGFGQIHRFAAGGISAPQIPVPGASGYDADGRTINLTNHIYNPVREAAEDSLDVTVRKLSFAGVFDS